MTMTATGSITVQEINTAANILTTILLFTLFYKLGFFKRDARKPTKTEPEILTWSPIDAKARSLASVPVRDAIGNMANATWHGGVEEWMYVGTEVIVEFEPIEYRSSY